MPGPGTRSLVFVCKYQSPHSPPGDSISMTGGGRGEVFDIITALGRANEQEWPDYGSGAWWESL